MSQPDDVRVEREQISPSAVYRQLDDHLGPEEAPYDVGAGLERLVKWMSDEPPASQAGHAVERLEAERLIRDRELAELRAKMIERTASLRMRSSLTAMGAVAFLTLLAGIGLFFGLPLVPVHAAVATVVAVAIIDALTASAVGYIHQTTMKSLQKDLQLSLGTRPEPRDEANRDLGNARERVPQPEAAKSQVEVLPGKASRTFQSVLVAIVAAAATATYWLSRSSGNWIPLAVVAGTAIFGLFALLIAVIMPAIWSRNSLRRDSSLRVLGAMLGLTIRIETPAANSRRRPSSNRTKAREHRSPPVGQSSEHGPERPRTDAR